MDGADFGVCIGRQESEQLMFAFDWIGFGAAFAAPTRPDTGEEGWFRRLKGLRRSLRQLDHLRYFRASETTRALHCAVRRQQGETLTRLMAAFTVTSLEGSVSVNERHCRND